MWMFETPAPPPAARIAYGPEEFQFGDLRLPSGPGPHPVIVVIHGGFWRAKYDLEHIGHVCAALTEQGFATWNLEFHRIGHELGAWPGTLLDVGHGADYVRQLAATYNLDLGRVISLGHSAGGHLALWLAARSRLAAHDPLYLADPLPLIGAVALGGVCDVKECYKLNLSNGVAREFLGGSPEEVPQRYADASPMELLPLGIPQVLIHGTADPNVPFSIAQGYYEKAIGLGDPVRLVPLPDAEHFEVIDTRSAEWPVVVQEVKQLFS